MLITTRFVICSASTRDCRDLCARLYPSVINTIIVTAPAFMTYRIQDTGVHVYTCIRPILKNRIVLVQYRIYTVGSHNPSPSLPSPIFL